MSVRSGGPRTRGERIDNIGRNVIVAEMSGDGHRSAHLFELLATVGTVGEVTVGGVLDGSAPLGSS